MLESVRLLDSERAIITALIAFAFLSSVSVLVSHNALPLLSAATASGNPGPIEIVGDAEFVSIAAAEEWPGSGISSDPYMILGLQISATTPYAISISETTVSFVMSECVLSGTSASVYLNDVKNGLIDGNLLQGSNYGVILSGCSGDTVSNNSCGVSGTCLSLVESDDCTLADNDLSSSLGVGIQMFDCVNITVKENIMTDCGLMLHPWREEHAITHSISNDNMVNGKPLCYLSGQNDATIPDNPGQVILAGCSNTTIEDIVLPGAAVGVMLYFSSNVTVSGVDSKENFWCGVNAEYCNGVSVIGCDLSKNHNNGLRIGSCNDTMVSGCDVSDNHMGLILTDCVDTQLVENLCANNDYGLFMSYSTNTTLVSNTFIKDDITIHGNHLDDWNSHSIDAGNTVNGKPIVYVSNQVGGTVPDGSGELILANCSGLVIEGYTFDSDLQTAVLMGLCENVTFSGCSFEDNSIGVYMQWSDGNNISGCEFQRSGLGIYAQYCKYNTFSNCTFAEGSCGVEVDVDSSYNDIFLNQFLGQWGYAITVERQSTGNRIHSNTFTDNNGATTIYSPSRAQCYDDSEGNLWSVNDYGNFWSDWTSPDEDDDGIVDLPYELAPDGGACDPFPLVVPPTYVPGKEPQQVKMMMQMGRTAFRAGEPVTFEAEVVNEGSTAVNLTFPNSQVVDFRVESLEGEVIFDYSPSVVWWPTTLVLEPGEVHSEELAWDPDVGELGNHTILACLNWYEGEALAAEAGITIDGSTPATEAVVQGTEGDADWYVSEVTVSLIAVDDLSGVTLVEYRIDESEWFVYSGELEFPDEGIHSLEYRSEDVAGNVESVHSVIVKVDCTAPVVSLGFEDGAILDSDVDISLDCHDTGSGVSRAEYSLDGGFYTGCEDLSSVHLIALADGAHTLELRVYDEAGNVASEELSFEVESASDGDEELTDPSGDRWPTWATLLVCLAVLSVAVLAATLVLLRRERGP